MLSDEEKRRRAVEPTAWELFWCPVLVAAGFVVVVATLTAVAIKLFT